MTLHNFEDCIDEVIVRRGDEYYDGEAVNDLEEIDKGRWCALVEGTEVYEVRVSLENDVIAESSCNCPYDHGPVCKHEVAVYFALRERFRGNKETVKGSAKTSKKASKKKISGDSTRPKKTVSQKIDEVLEKLGYEGLSSFVREYALEDREFRNSLLVNAARFEDDLDEEDYRDIIRAPINAAADFGYGGYRSNVNVFHGIDEVMRMAEGFLEKKKYKRLVPLCAVLIEEAVKSIEFIDDSNGELGGAIERAFEMLAECSPLLEKKDAEYLFNYCLGEALGRRYDGWEDWRWDLVRIASGLTSSASREKKLFSAIDGIVKLERQSDWGREYAEERAAKNKMDYFKKIKDEKRLADFIQSHLTVKSIREEALSRALKGRDYEKAKELARKGVDIAANKGHWGTVNEWKRRLLDIAVKEKNRDDERAYARELFVDARDFEYYDVFKKTYSGKEWSAPLSALIEELEKKDSSPWGRSALLPGIFIREKRWQDLLEYVRAHPTLECLEEHHRHLAVHFSADLYVLYERVVCDMLSKNTGRMNYQRAGRVLRRMKKLGRAKEVKALVEELGLLYKKRPALLDELRKV